MCLCGPWSFVTVRKSLLMSLMCVVVLDDAPIIIRGGIAKIEKCVAHKQFPSMLRFPNKKKKKQIKREGDREQNSATIAELLT